MKKIFTALCLFALSFSAVNAQVVYTNLENNPVVIGNGTTEYALNFFGGEAEFMIQNYYSEEVFFASFLPGTAVVSTPASYNANVTALAYNTVIGPSSQFYGFEDGYGSPYFNVLYVPGQTSFGQGMTGDKYVGFKFANNGNTYYGWARIDWDNVNVTLYGYAYNSTPNTPISAGDKGSSSSIESVELSGVSVYPNPATDVLNIEATNFESAIIMNSLGQKVMESNSNVINTSNLENGLYFVAVKTNAGTTTTKFIKK
ncbi:MAG: T9SS type A sorting domain-containing protein [Bacteroidales bacterium]|nr:T9SS type A sorting domain-containing protein [Bacteroidales bacterium]